MASSLLALLDDIATVLDDVAAMTKVAAQKTAGVLGDDLALNAQQVAGVQTARELPVVWAVAKGSMVNKVILVPAALALSVVLPVAIVPLMTIGGLYLCFEGAEKLVHRWVDHGGEKHEQALHAAVKNPAVDMMALEADKIRGAIRTDFVLSAEIVVISLGTVQDTSPWTQAGVLAAISLVMTVGVYGCVAGIVKLDDAGAALGRSASAWQRRLGAQILRAAPIFMKALSVVGTAAMFLVGGSIVAHAMGPVHHRLSGYGGLIQTLGEGAVGLVAGMLLVGAMISLRALRAKLT